MFQGGYKASIDMRKILKIRRCIVAYSLEGYVRKTFLYCVIIARCIQGFFFTVLYEKKA